jgi:Acetyltransferase (GNAT) domain
MTYRWLEGQEAIDELEGFIAAQGWTPLDAAHTRALAAYDGMTLVGFITLQMVGFVGPLYVAPGSRDGQVSSELSDRMYTFLGEVGAKGYLAVCDNPAAAKICRQHGMQEVKSPVYAA